MDLTIKDIAHLLIMAEKEVSQLVKKKEIPFQSLQDKIVFNKQQIIEWALGRNIPINLSGNTKLSEYHIESVGTLLGPESFHYHCAFHESSYIDEMVALIPFDKSVDSSVIIQLLKSRESMMSTAIGNGFSLPHPRIPLMVGRSKPFINFFFPERELDLNSIDGKPVHTLILLISQTIRQHLSLIAHLSFLLSDEGLRLALKNRVAYGGIMSLIEKIEEAKNKSR